MTKHNVILGAPDILKHSLLTALSSPAEPPVAHLVSRTDEVASSSHPRGYTPATSAGYRQAIPGGEFQEDPSSVWVNIMTEVDPSRDPLQDGPLREGHTYHRYLRSG
jgi:hypothetical protein